MRRLFSFYLFFFLGLHIPRIVCANRVPNNLFSQRDLGFRILVLQDKVFHAIFVPFESRDRSPAKLFGVIFKCVVFSSVSFLATFKFNGLSGVKERCHVASFICTKIVCFSWLRDARAHTNSQIKLKVLFLNLSVE